MVVCACHLSYLGNLNRRIVIQACLSKKQDPIPKINKAKMPGQWLKK
jgi:hypothetical protein